MRRMDSCTEREQMTSAIDPRIIEAFNSSHDFRLEDSCIMLALIGSTSHNTYVPKEDPNSIDDVDYMGVLIPPLKHTLGLGGFEHWTFMQDELDVVIYSLEKFMRLLVKSNPNVLGTLWLKPEFYIVNRATWKRVVVKRSLFATRAAHGSFAGYANGQLKKMTSFDLQAQEDWDRVNDYLRRAGWTLEQVLRNEHTEMPADPTLHKDSIEWMRVMAKRIHARHFQGYMGEKRKALVKKYGYDCKNAAHLIRLLRMCIEFLETGEINVWRDGADGAEIRAIKAGQWSLIQVQDEAERLFQIANDARDKSQLPYGPNIEAISEVLVDTQMMHYGYGSQGKVRA